MKPIALSLAVMVAAGATIAVAQTQNRGSPNAAPSKSSPPSKSAQPTAAAQGGGVQQCVACHGEHGEGNAQGGFPRIAGQSQEYLLHQLESYANGSRRNPVMEPIAKGLSREARTAAAAYYAGMQTPASGGATTGSAAPAAGSDRGEVLAVRGDDGKQVQGCRNCHGPGGIGEAPDIPYLAGLDAKYLASALNAFKSGARRNDAGAQMRTVVRGLSGDDIAAVSQYFASLSPPARPAPQNVVRAPTGGAGSTSATTPRPSATSRPTGQSQGQVGSEQGAGTSGGAQGAGGVDQSSATQKGTGSSAR